MAVQLFKELIDGNGHLEIPEGVRKILPNTLMNCEKLTSVSIPRSVTVIGACSFLGCKNLRRVEFREGLRTIDVAAFMGCSNLESIVILEGVRIIAHDAFRGCTGLTRIVLPSSVTVIGQGAFEGCSCLNDDDRSLIVAKESVHDVLDISTTACIAGPKEAMVKILNQAFRLFGRDKIVVDADASLEEMNEIIQEARYHMEGDPDLEDQPAEYGAQFTLMDFLDDYNRMHSPCKDFVFSYIDDDEPDGTEDYGVGLVDVTKNGDEYILKILSQVNESQDTYWDEDWRDWCGRMVRLYGCKVFLHKVSEVYESDIHEEETRLFELVGDSVKETALNEFPYGDHVRGTDDEIPF